MLYAAFTTDSDNNDSSESKVAVATSTVRDDVVAVTTMTMSEGSCTTQEKDNDDKQQQQQQQHHTLPPVSPEHWRHRPIYMMSRHSSELENEEQGPLPLGVPFDIDTDLFHGKLLIRFCNTKSDDSIRHKAYFDGRRRVMQYVIQGKFKTNNVNMASLYAGNIFDEPLDMKPPVSFQKLLKLVFAKISPGTKWDLSSARNPHVLALLGGAAQTIHMQLPGEPLPDMTAVDLPEHMWLTSSTEKQRTSAGEAAEEVVTTKTFKDVAERKAYLLNPKNAQKHYFDTEHIYTIQSYDHSMDFGSYQMHLPIVGKFDLCRVLGPQPLGLSCIMSTDENDENNNNKVLFKLDIWHERIYEKKKIQQQNRHRRRPWSRKGNK